MRAGRDFSPDVRTCFHQVPKRFRRAPQVPKLFPVAPQFYAICFHHSLSFMDIIWEEETDWATVNPHPPVFCWVPVPLVNHGG